MRSCTRKYSARNASHDTNAFAAQGSFILIAGRSENIGFGA